MTHSAGSSGSKCRVCFRLFTPIQLLASDPGGSIFCDMISVHLFLILLPHIAQSAPNLPLYISPPPQDPRTPAPGETAFLLPVPDPLPPTSASTASSRQTPLVMAYYPDWAGPSFPPEKIDFTRFDWIDFAFALPTEQGDLTWDDPDLAPALLKRLVTCAHSKDKKVKLSIGGWTGSRFVQLLTTRLRNSPLFRYFSSVVNTSQSRETFVENIVDTYDTFSLDGIDIDWEYPGKQGAGKNQVSESDSANFLSFLQLLRTRLPPSAAITAATLPTTFYGSDGEPMRDVSQFAEALDWILLMNYDVWSCK